MFAFATKTLALLAALSTVEAAREVNMTVEANGDWQLYTFAQSWQPEFCYHQNYPGCSSPNDFWTTSLTIHGLWPDVTSGQYPSSCTDEQFDLGTVTAAVSFDTLTTYWPNVKSSTSSSSYTSFWEHEWSVHGTCSGLDQATFFQTAVNLLINNPTPSIIGDNYGQSVSTEDVRAAYGGDDQVILQCTGRFLKQVLTCWTRGDDNTPTGRRSCPPNLLAEDNCSGSTITISTF